MRRRQAQRSALQDEGSHTAPDRSHKCWMPELVLRFAGFLTCNEVAFILRLANKATAAQFGRPQDRTVRLSLPVPHHAFVWRWGGARAMHSLTRSRRRQLACLTARSGSTANLELLLARGAKGHVLDQEVFDAAAAAGQLEVCRLLWQQGCCYGPNLLHHAAAGGHGAVYEWCLETIPGCADHHTAGDAARAGNVALMDWLLLAEPSPNVSKLLAGAASGCDWLTLVGLCTRYSWRVQLDRTRARVLAAAAGSPTADWRLKVEWLELRWYPFSAAACVEAARLPDGLARLQWLRPQGYPLSAEVVSAAASSGNVEALQFVLAAGVALDDDAAQGMVEDAAAAGHLAVLRALPQTPGVLRSLRSHAAPAATENGRLQVVTWLVGMLGGAQVLTERVSKSAVRSGSMELLAWLHAHGCPWDASAFAAAAEWGSDEQLEWLAARGCPMGAEGEAYMRAAAHGDLSMLHGADVLARL
ncbi:Ankyrin repeat domain-containing protein [Tetrabaena socialis]|uniref:Ankyrin repeat domain-containing protein n=1 Tax=Tetrabaena socialis TaxID=47790 RepID=A0A2J8A0F4_9CHLO|nr:Ankyrin repeat domain-containing protein [Tetrabaena socialis]|eukprot:PNH05986.1 Ankyrin repeat domain-containing protein [Tetrabaena socialis]